MTATEASPPPLLDAHGVSVSINGSRILADAALQLRPGQAVGLIGPNGSGKSTLIKACAGLQKTAGGTIKLEGQPLASMRPAQRARLLAYMPQNPTPHSFTVEQAVTMGLYAQTGRFAKLSPQHRARLDQSLRQTGLEGMRGRIYNTLSGGERRRAALARALIQASPALLLDEPVAEMDLKHSLATLTLVHKLAQQGKAVLVALHDLELAARFCHRLVLLHNGSVAATGTPRQVITPARLASVFEVEAEVGSSPVTGQLQVHLKGPASPS